MREGTQSLEILFSSYRAIVFEINDPHSSHFLGRGAVPSSGAATDTPASAGPSTVVGSVAGVASVSGVASVLRSRFRLLVQFPEELGQEVATGVSLRPYRHDLHNGGVGLIGFVHVRELDEILQGEIFR